MLPDRISRVAAKAVRCLLPFPNTYLCESSFSTLAFLKNKYRARLEPENAMRLSLSTISPRIDRLSGLHHAQISHCQVSLPSLHTHTHTCTRTAVGRRLLSGQNGGPWDKTMTFEKVGMNLKN